MNAPSSAHDSETVPNDEPTRTTAAVFARQPLHNPLRYPAYWTPEQALAVVELLDDLRELIWAHYDVQLIDLDPDRTHRLAG